MPDNLSGMPFPQPDMLRPVVSPLAEERDLDVEDIKTTKAGKKSQVVIRVDGDEHPSSDALEELSRDISAAFDAAEENGQLNFGAGYTLEVSTPGVDLPLTAPRHWRRNRGRLASITFGDKSAKPEKWRIGAVGTFANGAPAEAANNGADPEAVALFKQSKKQLLSRIEQLENIAHAVVEIEFARVPEAEKEAAGLPFVQAVEKAAVKRED